MLNHNCKDELKEVNLKATSARLAVLKLLEKTDQPLDVATIIGYLNNHQIKADPVTAFRIINQFTDKGLTQKVQLKEGKFRYELSSKPDHHHLVCESCGRIEDMPECQVGLLEKDIFKNKQFKVSSHSLEFFGKCLSCQ